MPLLGLRANYICQSVVFVLTFFSYALLHANRKSFSNVKPTLKEVWTGINLNETELHPRSTWNRTNMFATPDSAELFLGTLDTIFMAFYAIGLFLNGYIGDRLDPRFVLSFGMMASALTLFFFGVVTEWLKYYNVYLYGFLFSLNGLFQSTGWPATVTIMSNWFGHSRGFWLGLWSACACVGNIIGDILTGGVLKYGYEYGFLVPASILFSGGLIVLFGMVTKPEHLGSSNDKYEPLINNSQNCTVDTQFENHPYESESIDSSANQKGYVSIRKIILIPGVIPYSLAYACLKSVNYAFFFWLSEYLTTNFHWTNEESDDISIWYDVGGIIGGIVTGIISDLMWSRSPVTIASLILTIPALVLYQKAPGDKLKNSIYLGVTGVFIGGPATLISSAISADLGSQPLLSGNEAALSTVTGIVDGTGSIGAAIGQICVPLISQKFGWENVFVYFMIMISITIVCLMPVLVKDVWRRFRNGCCQSNRFRELKSGE